MFFNLILIFSIISVDRRLGLLVLSFKAIVSCMEQLMSLSLVETLGLAR